MPGEQGHAVLPNVLEEEVAEGHARHSGAYGSIEQWLDGCLVLRIAARPGQLDPLDGEACCSGLFFQESDAYGVHGNAFELPVYGGEQARHAMRIGSA